VGTLCLAVRPPEDLVARLWSRLFGRPRRYEANKQREVRRALRRRARFQLRARPGQRRTS